jgi:hypothetical protein
MRRDCTNGKGSDGAGKVCAGCAGRSGTRGIENYPTLCVCMYIIMHASCAGLGRATV